jgi:hypothetical protein
MKMNKLCRTARQGCAELLAAAYANDVESIRAASLEQLCAQKSPCCFDNVRIEHMACFGGAYEVFLVLLKKGITMTIRERVSVQTAYMENVYEMARRSGSEPLQALLRRGFIDVPISWAKVRLFFLGRRDPACVFYGAPKDIARLLAQTSTDEHWFLTDLRHILDNDPESLPWVNEESYYSLRRSIESSNE